MNLQKYDIKQTKAIENWDEALPIGNGKIGCLIYGDGKMRFSVDRVDLWDSRQSPATKEEGFNYANMIKLLEDGTEQSWQEYTRLFDNVYTDEAYPTKITAGRITLDFGVKTENITSLVDITKAIATVEIPESQIRIESFASATKFIGVARIYGKYAIDINIPAYISAGRSKEEQENPLLRKKLLAYPLAEIIRDGEFIYYDQKTFTDFRYGIVAMKKELDTYSELYFTIATNKDGDDFISKAKDELISAYNIGYDALKDEHINWWKKYWAKSEISIGDDLLEKVYYRSYYLFASTSRKGFFPMPLQGVWTADNDAIPPWRGDYHHDTNTELSYQSFLKANRLPEGEVFIDYLWNLRDEYRKLARDFYGVKGLLLPSSSTIDGKPMGGWPQYALSPTMTIWAAQSFDEYYLYTGDKKFLRTKAYPFFKEVGEAIYGLFKEEKGKLYLPLSSSPEIHDNRRESYLKPNSNFDLALIIYLYKTLSRYCDILNKKKDKYEKILSKLDKIALQKGVVMIDSTEILTESHRHFSHLMCLYPLHLINYDSDENKRIYEASLLNIEKYGSGMWIGFSFAMCAQIYAMAYKGNAAYEKLYQFANGFVSENGFHLNGDFKNFGYTTFHYRPFTLESLFGYCDALQEMLLQDHQGYLDLFPAIPDAWKKQKVSFKNFRSYGGVLVNAELEKGVMKKISLSIHRKMNVKIKNPFGAGGATVTYQSLPSGTVVKRNSVIEIEILYLDFED